MIEDVKYTWKNLVAVSLSLLGLLLFGMIGYMIIESWSWHDALYMTFITFSTVGVGEVGTLHWSGRLFSMMIIRNSTTKQASNRQVRLDTKLKAHEIF